MFTIRIDSGKSFQSTPSAWRETKIPDGLQGRYLHFNPLPPHGGRHYARLFFQKILYFNPLPPHGGRLLLPFLYTLHSSFQSTPSAWRETGSNSVEVCEFFYFNPLPPHGGRPAELERLRYICEISIHSLRMEGDSILPGDSQAMNHFNPLPPHGGRPVATCFFGSFSVISIHSLRMEGDVLRT